jgi:hypothetical protein
MKKILCIGDLALDVISQLKEPINYGKFLATQVGKLQMLQPGLPEPIQRLI